MDVTKNRSLKQSHTLRSQSQCALFCQPRSRADVEQLPLLSEKHDIPIRVLGSGSNLIISNDLNVLVAQPRNKGIKVLEQTHSGVIIEVQGGESWHDLVLWSVDQGFSGLENLALIPGTVGAAPVQNIGAYGVEFSSVVVSVTAYHLLSRLWKTLDSEHCQFQYRDSIFKAKENEYVIFSVILTLSTNLKPVLNYGPLSDLLHTVDLSSKKICQRVIDIRSEKLPDPALIPNAGSFFKNPIITEHHLSLMLEKYPDLVFYAQVKGAKLAAGWLIEQCGLKGRSDIDSGVGCYEKQALVLTNPSEANATSILIWAEVVQKSVFDMFGVELEVEPRAWR